MHKRDTQISIGLATVVLVSACSGSAGLPTVTAPPPLPADTAPPPVQREMRGLWTATVANIDWPSRTTLTADQQRAELADIFDRAAAAGFNAVVFQVRPAADAVYISSIEPWASMLAGVQGTDPGYDPLTLAIQLAHARGIELHAWINPFRAGNAADSGKLAATHLFNTRRDLVRVYGTQLWLDPGEPAVQDHVMRVVRDIVQRYDIDAIHADDYFYPYREKDTSGRILDFPDSASFARSGSTLSRDDWRRANIDDFVARLYREVHAIKPAIKVGISPFGIWRPGNPAGVAGLDAYASIYADSRKWLQQGWVDYLAPQLYWPISAPQQSFPALLDWWIAQSTAGRHVWPGLAASRAGSSAPNAFPISEITDQIRLIRARPAGTGEILFNTTATLERSYGALASAIAPLYSSRAIPPASPWLGGTGPTTPSLSVIGTAVQMTPGIGTAVRWWVVRARTSGTWSTRVVFGDQRSDSLHRQPDRVVLNAVDEAGNMSPPADWAKK